MIIDSSQLTLNSQYQFSREKIVTESYIEGFNRPAEAWAEDTLQQGRISRRQQISLYNQNGRLSTANTSLVESLQPNLWQRVTNEPTILNITNAPPTASTSITEQTDANMQSNTPQLSARMQLMVSLIEAMTGKKINFIDQPSIKPSVTTSSNNVSTAEGSVENLPLSEFGSLYQYSESTTQAQSTQFQAQGTLLTRSGKSLEVNLQLDMSRDFTERFQLEVREGAAILKDPLVINFTTNGVQLSNDKFMFDIDADGVNDNISFVTADSGFLALDKNFDGKIDNGSELFGAISGNGFAELSQYDDDNNQFIDEADGIFQQLRIWVRDENGNQQLYTLAEANVGAIYLQSAETPFDLRNNNNELSGAVRSSGIYLTESGQSLSIQQIDLLV